MPILFNQSDESCLDPEGLKRRRFFGDRLMRVLVYLCKKGISPETLHLNSKNTALFEDQFGVNHTTIYGPMGECKIIKSGNH